MKPIIKISTIICAGLLMFSCTKEKAEEPNADFSILKLFPDGYREVDTIHAGDFVNLQIKKPAEMVVFYTGRPGYRYSLSKFFGGDNVALVSTNGKIENYRFYNTGLDTVVCVATNYGNWSEQQKRDIKTKILTIIP
jgi:hypothetical protein